LVQSSSKKLVHTSMIFQKEIPADATKTEDGQYILNGVVYDSITHVVTITVIDNG